MCVCVLSRGGIFTPETAPLSPYPSSVSPKDMSSPNLHISSPIKSNPPELKSRMTPMLSSASAESCSCFSALTPSFLKNRKADGLFSPPTETRAARTTLSVPLNVVFCSVFFFCCQTRLGTHTHTHNCASVPPVVAENAHKTVTLGGIACQEKCSCRGMADSRPKQPPEAHPEHSRGAL